MVLNIVNQYFAQLGYIIIGVATFAEGLTLPFPALAVLLMAGAASATGKMSFELIVLIASTSYTLGSIVPYIIGYNLPKMKTLPWAGRFIESSLRYLETVNQLFKKHGEKIVALARPFWIGNCVSYFAGLNRMPPVKFFIYTFLGIGAWSSAAVYVGQLFRNNLAKAAQVLQHYTWLAFVAIVIIIMIGWWVSRCLKSRQSITTTPTRD